MISFKDFIKEEVGAANSTGSVGVAPKDVSNIGPRKKRYRVLTRNYIEVLGKRKRHVK